MMEVPVKKTFEQMLEESLALGGDPGVSLSKQAE
jgi:hypothetical protein